MDCQMGAQGQTQQQQQTQFMPDLTDATTPAISTAKGLNSSSSGNNNGSAATTGQSEPPKRRARKRTRVEGSPH